MELCWKTAISKSKNREYYINIEKGVSQWGESKSELPLGWEAHISHKVPRGIFFYPGDEKKYFFSTPGTGKKITFKI